MRSRHRLVEKILQTYEASKSYGDYSVLCKRTRIEDIFASSAASLANCGLQVWELADWVPLVPSQNERLEAALRSRHTSALPVEVALPAGTPQARELQHMFLDKAKLGEWAHCPRPTTKDS